MRCRLSSTARCKAKNGHLHLDVALVTCRTVDIRMLMIVTTHNFSENSIIAFAIIYYSRTVCANVKKTHFYSKTVFYWFNT